MKSMVAVIAGAMVLSGVANAQTASAPSLRDYETGYVEAQAQSAFGNVTSQSFGVEVGVNVAPRLRVFAEVGMVRDSAPASLGDGAQLIASYLSLTQSAAVSFSVRQPVLLLGAGVRYVIPYDSRLEPYVLGGFGVARIKRDVRFTVGGTDVTDTIGSYFVTLGSDLSGSENTPLFTAGGGVIWNVRPALFVDLQYRFGRVFDEGQAFNINRAGAGIGFRF